MKNLEISTYKIKLLDNLSLSQTTNLLAILKICVGAQFLLTVNINVGDKLIKALLEL